MPLDGPSVQSGYCVQQLLVWTGRGLLYTGHFLPGWRMFLTRNRTDADCHCFENAYRRDTHTTTVGEADRHVDSKCNSNGTGGASRR